MVNTKMRQHVSKFLAGVTLFTAVFAISGVSQAQVAEAAPAVTSGRVNFRLGPSTNYSTQGKLLKGTAIDVISHYTNWSKIEESGRVGFISNRYIDFTTTGFITGRVNMRTQGSMSGSILMKIPAGQTVQVLAGPVSGWYKVTYLKTEGYIYKNYITLNESSGSPVAEDPVIKENPIVDGKTYVTSEPVLTYMNAADARNGLNSVGNYREGTYHIYKEYSGMLNISTRENTAGAWINPEQSTSSTPPDTGSPYDGYEPMTWTFSFYTNLPEHNGGWDTTALGTKLRYGVLASNYWPLRTEVILPGWGEFTVEDRGGSNFDSKYRMDMLIPRKAGETDYEYSSRIWSMGHQEISGYIKSSK